jgi:23S rRNA-/tRNA-specific pseudouridylate synthase
MISTVRNVGSFSMFNIINSKPTRSILRTSLPIRRLSYLSASTVDTETTSTVLVGLVVEDEYWIQPRKEEESLSSPSFPSLGEYLMKRDPYRFPSKSQVRKAIRYGWIVYGSSSSSSSSSLSSVSMPISTSSNYYKCCNRTQSLMESDPKLIFWTPKSINMPLSYDRGVILVLDRDYHHDHRRQVENGYDNPSFTTLSCYPSAVTKYLFPPSPSMSSSSSSISESSSSLSTSNDSSSCTGIRIVYEDDDLAVVDKPANMTTIDPTYKPMEEGCRDSGANEDGPDLMSCLGFILKPPPIPTSQKQHIVGQCIPPIPRPVHRLDRKTRGLVIVAKKDEAMTSLSRQFADGLVNKTYVAVVALDPNHASTALRDGTQNHRNTTTTPSLFSSSSWQLIDYPIDGKPSQTEWCVVKYQPPYALLQIRPHQGRTHQIRRHLAYNLNSPTIGDTKYTSKQQTQLLLRNEGNQHVHDDDGMMYLCCYELEFQHPSSTRRSLLTETTTPESFSKHSGAESAQSLPDGAAVIKSDCETGRLMKIHMPIPDAFWNKLSVGTKIVDPDGDKTT